jgi:hypothetical protein
MVSNLREGVETADKDIDAPGMRAVALVVVAACLRFQVAATTKR